MVKKTVIKEIDKAIKQIWLEDIQGDYRNNMLLREYSLECSMYHHLRVKLEDLLLENNLRIYPEYVFSAPKYRADLAIVQINPHADGYLGDIVTDVIALFEMKLTSGTDDATVEWVKNDIWKFKDYMTEAGLTDCQFYFTTIYESPCKWLQWMDARTTNNWAFGRVTELDAGLIDGEMVFEVHSYNEMNKRLNSKGRIATDC